MILSKKIFILFVFIATQPTLAMQENASISAPEAKKLNTRFAQATYLKKYSKALQLLAQGANPNAPLDNGCSTILHLVAAEGDDQRLIFLIAIGADMNCKDTELKTPL